MVFAYNSITTNPPLAADQKRDGAASGIIEIKEGDVPRVPLSVSGFGGITVGQPLCKRMRDIQARAVAE